MKLFLRQDLCRDQVIPENVFFTFGNKILPVAFKSKPLVQGYYFKIELPISFTRKYFHCGAMEFREGKCRPAFAFFARKWECIDKYTYDFRTTWVRAYSPE